MVVPRGLLQFIMYPKQELAYHTGCILTGINIRPQAEGWLMVVKVTDRKGEPMVAFVTGRTFYDLWDLLYTAASGDKVTLKWKKDKWPKG